MESQLEVNNLVCSFQAGVQVENAAVLLIILIWNVRKQEKQVMLLTLMYRHPPKMEQYLGKTQGPASWKKSYQYHWLQRPGPIVSYTYDQPKYTDCRGRLLQAQPHKYSHSPAIRLPWEKALKGNIPPYFCALSPPAFKLGTGSNTNLQWKALWVQSCCTPVSSTPFVNTIIGNWGPKTWLVFISIFFTLFVWQSVILTGKAESINTQISVLMPHQYIRPWCHFPKSWGET